MTVLKNELKKIFTLKSIIILLMITGIMYKIFIIPQSQVISRSHIIENIVIDMINDYGNSMDEEEYLDFKGKYNEKVKIAEEHIKNNKEFSDLDIYNYEDFYKIARNDGEEKYNNPKLLDLYWGYIGSEEFPIFEELNQFENIILCYEAIVLGIGNIHIDDSESIKMVNRKQEIKESKDIQSLMPYTIFQEYEIQLKWVMVLILVSIIFLISPIYLNDKKDKTIYLQYSSKLGRNLFKKKVIASMIISIVIASLQIILFLKFYSTQNTGIFLDCKISGFFNTPIKSWYDLTFSNYIVVTIICVYILSVIVSLISMFISSKVNNYITLIGIHVPIIFIISRVLLQVLISKVTSIDITMNRIGYINMPKYSMLIIYTLMILISFVGMYYRNKKEHEYDIN